MSSTETRPVESDADTGEDDGYAHYARKDEIAKAAVLGGQSRRSVATGFSRFATPPGSRSARAARSSPPCSTTERTRQTPQLPARHAPPPGLLVGCRRAVQ